MNSDVKAFIKNLLGTIPNITSASVSKEFLSKIVHNGSVKKAKFKSVLKESAIKLDTMLSYLRDYAKGKELSEDAAKVVPVFLAACIYFINPFDIVPDFLLLGFIDDIQVINFVAMYFSKTINNYRSSVDMEKQQKQSATKDNQDKSQKQTNHQKAKQDKQKTKQTIKKTTNQKKAAKIKKTSSSLQANIKDQGDEVLQFALSNVSKFKKPSTKKAVKKTATKAVQKAKSIKTLSKISKPLSKVKTTKIKKSSSSKTKG